MGILILASVKKQTQYSLGEEIQNIYNQEQTQNQKNIVPIYTEEQLRKIGTGEKINISEEGNKTYAFEKTSEYILRNNLEITLNTLILLNDNKKD